MRIARLHGFFGRLLGFLDTLPFDFLDAFDFGIVVFDILRALGGVGGFLGFGLREFVGVGFLARGVFGGATSAFGGFGGFFLLVAVHFLHQRNALLLGLILADIQARCAALNLRLVPNGAANLRLLIQTAIDEEFLVAGGLGARQFGVGLLLAGDGGLFDLLGFAHAVDLCGAVLQVLWRKRIVLGQLLVGIIRMRTAQK